MKSKVQLSTFCYILTAVISLILFGLLVATIQKGPEFFGVLALYLVVIFLSLYNAPLYVCADPSNVSVKSVLHSIRIPVASIASVELYQPTMGSIRLFASGGYLGYWGYFREGDTGTYRGAFGKASDCFMIRMKNGDKYVLGCENPGEMVDYIRKQIGQ